MTLQLFIGENPPKVHLINTQMKDQNHHKLYQEQLVIILKSPSPFDQPVYLHPLKQKKIMSLLVDAEQCSLPIIQNSHHLQSLESPFVDKIKEPFKQDTQLTQEATEGEKSIFLNSQQGKFQHQTARKIQSKQTSPKKIKQRTVSPFNRSNLNKSLVGKRVKVTSTQGHEIEENAQDQTQFKYNEAKKNPNFEGECFIYGNSKNPEKAVLKITKTKLSIGPIVISMQKVMKIKIFPSEVCSQCKNVFKQYLQTSKENQQTKFLQQDFKIQKQNMIKISISENVFNFTQRYPLLSAEPKQQFSPSIISYADHIQKLPLPFLSFAKIILKKLKSLYPTIKSTNWKQPSFKLRAVIKTDQKKTLFLSNQITKKTNIRNYGFIHGMIYKKSKHRSNWQKRYVIINKEGVYSYKHESDENYSISIEVQSVKYMWTWFTILKVDQQKDQLNQNREYEVYTNQIMHKPQDGSKDKSDHKLDKFSPPQSDKTGLKKNENPYLIIKLKHGFNGQTQFGIPICGFDNQVNMARNWLFAFYKFVSQYQY